MTAAGGAERLEAEGKRRENGEWGGGGGTTEADRKLEREGGGGITEAYRNLEREREKGVGLGGGGGELVNPDEKSLPVFVSAFYVLWGTGEGSRQ